MKYRCSFSYKCDENERQGLVKAIAPELESQEPKRSRIRIEKGSGFRAVIESDDISGLRAAFNSLTKLISAFKEMEMIK